MAHVLSQAVKGLLTGANKGRQSQRSSLFSASEDAGRARYWAARLEFQDGKRKRGVFREAQFYHGRGTIHVHILLWLQGAHNMDLASIIRADILHHQRPSCVTLCSVRSWTGHQAAGPSARSPPRCVRPIKGSCYTPQRLRPAVPCLPPRRADGSPVPHRCLGLGRTCDGPEVLCQPLGNAI